MATSLTSVRVLEKGSRHLESLFLDIRYLLGEKKKKSILVCIEFGMLQVHLYVIYNILSSLNRVS